ncbi:MAG: DedA family protein [Paludibacteraceae bacterium]|nr:DedA family protein [Paludibacteraceae bacterium]
MSLVDNIIAWYSAHMNYASITALMAVESSFIPFPSEVVIPPAAFVAGQPESVLCATGNYPIDVLLIVLFGTLGAMIGAIINYGLSVWLGRLIIYKFADSKLGHLCLLSSEKLERAEEYFREKGNVSTFVGRFIPGIRQLISIPAGLSRMNFGSFLWWTFLGAFIWNCVLAAVGYVAAGQMDLIKKYSHELSVAILILLGAVILYYLVRWLIKRSKRA